jgi:phage tail-like protein
MVERAPHRGAVRVTTASTRAWLLDRGAGWRQAAQTGVVSDDQGALTLGALPGRATRIEGLPEDATWRWPAGLAGDPVRGLLVTDTGAHLVRRLVLERPEGRRVRRLAVLPTMGGAGRSPRRLMQPRGIALLRRGAIAIADSGNHRIQVFSPPPYALLHAWGARDRFGEPAPGTGDLEFERPWDLVADRCGTLYVADRGNKRIQRIDAAGVPLEPLGVGLLSDPTKVAIAGDGTLAVVERNVQRLWVFSPARVFPVPLTDLDQPASVAFGVDGTLYVGDEDGRIHVYRDGGAGRWTRAGSGVTGLDGSIEHLFWWNETQGRLIAIIHDAGADRPRLWSVDPLGGRALEGSFIAGPLDSGIEKCQWHRVQVQASVPRGTSITLESFAAEDATNVHPPPTHPDFSGWIRSGLAGEPDPDCLVQSGPGRFLWLRVTLRSNGQQAPAVQRIRVSFPRASYLEYLPAVFQEDDESRRFLERFLAIFQSGFEDFDGAIDRVPELADPYLVPARHLRWLASWVALTVHPEWPEHDEAKLRREIARAVESYRRRGTPDGLRQAIQTYADVDAQILEHYRLRRWPRLSRAASLDGTEPLWSRDVYQRLQVTSYSQVGAFRLTSRPEPALEAHEWGAHRFSVFFHASPYDVEETHKRVSDVVEREKPAHTEASLCPVYPRLRVGVQASVGVDTLVGTTSYLVLGRLATLNYDAILACSREEQALIAMGSAVRPAVGETTRLP